MFLAQLCVLSSFALVCATNPEDPGAAPPRVSLPPATLPGFAVPVATSLSPSSVVADGVAKAITVNGGNFTPQSLVRCNGFAVPTTYVNSTSLVGLVPASYFQVVGSPSITVVTPGPGGGLSQPLSLTVVNPVPTVTGFSQSVVPFGVDTPVTAYGSGFNGSTSVTLDWGTDTNFVCAILWNSPNAVTFQAPGWLFSQATAANLIVTNAGPGGGTASLQRLMFAPPAMPIVDDNPVTFSVSGPVHRQTDGLRYQRGLGSSATYGLRTPTVTQAAGLFTPQFGDVRDYAMALMPAEAELFQSEPWSLPARPSGTNNQILIADSLGLVAGVGLAAYRDNLDGFTFGEDWFGVAGVALGTQPGGVTGGLVPWSARASQFLPNTVTIDIGTSFRFSGDPWARGLPRTGFAIESLRFDGGSGTGPWDSPGDAGAEVFGTPVLTLPGASLFGSNDLVHDRVDLALANAMAGGAPAEDDLDALECIGDNDPGSWFPWMPGMMGPGNLHARVVETGPHAAYPDGLAPPGIATHAVGYGPYGYAPPVFFSVDRRSTGRALSAVRTQYRSNEAAGDVFMAWNGNNLLLIDEQELGLYPGAAGLACDDLDALLLNVHPEDRYYLIELAQYHVPYSGLLIDNDPNPSVVGDEWRSGPGYSYSLLRYAWERDGRVLRMRVGFSVSNTSIGLEGTPVDYEAGLDPSGFMQQAGDIYFTQFGDYGPMLGIVNPAPVGGPNGTHYLWYEETQIGLETGDWVLGMSPQGLERLPDELDALDSAPVPPGGTHMPCPYGPGVPGTDGFIPIFDINGRSAADVLTFGIGNGLGGAACFVGQSLAPAALPTPFGFELLLDPSSLVVLYAGTLTGSQPGQGAKLMKMNLPPGLFGVELASQALVLDPAGADNQFAVSNGVIVRL